MNRVGEGLKPSRRWTLPTMGWEPRVSHHVQAQSVMHAA